MFRDPATRRSDYKTGSSGDIEKIGAVASGTHNIHQVWSVNFYTTGIFTQNLHTTGDFIYAFAFHTQTQKKCSNLHIRGSGRHDLAHDLNHFFS